MSNHHNDEPPSRHVSKVVRTARFEQQLKERAEQEAVAKRTVDERRAAKSPPPQIPRDTYPAEQRAEMRRARLEVMPASLKDKTGLVRALLELNHTDLLKETDELATLLPQKCITPSCEDFVRGWQTVADVYVLHSQFNLLPDWVVKATQQQTDDLGRAYQALYRAYEALVQREDVRQYELYKPLMRWHPAYETRFAELLEARQAQRAVLTLVPRTNPTEGSKPPLGGIRHRAPQGKKRRRLISYTTEGLPRIGVR